jgi:putative DNA primase/helicase
MRRPLVAKARVETSKVAGQAEPSPTLHAEQSVLGGLLLDNSRYAEVAKIVGLDDFGEEYHKPIFQAIGALITAGKPADQLTVAEWLEHEGALEYVGSHRYLGSLALNTPSAANIRRYAEVVRERALERRRASAAVKTKRQVQRVVDWQEFFERYTLIYPTDTCWDAEVGRIVKISAMKHAHGEGTIKFWQENPERRMVNTDQVVFDPTGRAPAGSVNLFRGLPKPAQGGECSRMIALANHLCGDDHNLLDHVLKWTAFPLQNPGAKMQTAVVMHGPEGAGKNLFWNTIREIYGEYGSLITQAELESPYNAWLSQRLFMIANEVISRQELRHYVGRLKNLVTESPLPISEKYLPLRYEANHMNLVFLTNELHALQLSPGDRRYIVIKTPHQLDDNFYREVVTEIEAGGRGALYRYLLEYGCDGFDEHTKPIRTAAKEDLIEIGRNSAQQFWHELHQGLIPLPYGPALSEDLYRAYTFWCPRVGERNAMRLNLFSHQFMAMNGVSRKVMRVPHPERAEEAALPADRLRQRTVFLMGARPEDQEEGSWVKKNIATFREQLREFARDDGWRRQSDSAPEAKGWTQSDPAC